MLSLERNGYTADQVRAALHAPRRRLSFRYELLDKLGAHKADLTNVLGGSVEYNSLAEIKRTARFTLRDDGQINFLADRIKPYARLHMPPQPCTGGAATFTRSSEARRPSDGLLVQADQPRFGPGKVGQGLLIEEASSNIQVRDLLTWAKGGTLTTVVETAAVAPPIPGEKVYLVTLGDAATTTPYILKSSSNLLGDYATSLYVMPLDIGNVTIGQRSGSGADVDYPNLPLNKWSRISATTNYAVSTNAGSIFFTKDAGAKNGGTRRFYLCAAQLEAKAFPTSFFGGSRSADIVTLPTSVFGQKSGMFETWVQVPVGVGARNFVIFDTRTAAYTGVVGYIGTNRKAMMIVGQDTTQYILTGTTILTAGQWVRLGFGYSEGGASLQVNGIEEAASSQAPALSWGATWRLGANYSGGEALNSLIDEVRISSAPRPASGSAGGGMPADELTTAKLSLDETLDWLYWRPEDLVEFPLGVFIPSTPPRKADAAGVITREVEAYDLLQVLTDDKVADRYTIAQGTNYITAVKALLDSAGVTAQNLTPSSSTLPADRDWDPGTPKLRIINDMLDAINYRSLWFDADGVAVAQPYVSPADRAAEYTYQDDGQSVIVPEVQESLDLFAVANKWVLTVSEADRPPLRSEYTNANVNSPTSTVSRGRTIVDYRQVEAADQAALDAMAARIAFEASQVYQQVEFETAIMPMHSDSDVLNLRFGPLGLDAKYSEVGWSFDLKAGGRMRHRVRRVVTV